MATEHEMTHDEHLLICLAEECAEVAQRVSKALRFGLSEIQPGQSLTNAERIDEEFVDLLSVVLICVDRKMLDAPFPTPAQAMAKRDKIEKFMAISRAQGTLTTGDENDG